MRSILLLTISFLLSVHLQAQVAISNNAAPADANTMLDIKSNNKGVKFPRVTTAERKAIPVSVADAGLMLYDTDKQTLYMYDGFSWLPFATAGRIPARILKKNYPAPGQFLAFRYGWCASLDGEHAVVSAPEDTAGGVSGAGSVFTYKKINGVWQQQQRITASSPHTGDYYGRAVSISGNYMAIGAPGTDGQYNGQGAVYIYAYFNGAWQFQQKLVAGDGNLNQGFGGAVCIKGTTVVIGAAGSKVGNNLNQGAVYVFRRLLPNWMQQAKIVAADGGPTAYFGASVDLDGDYVAIGSTLAVVDGTAKGAAYVYVDGGGTFTLQQKLSYLQGSADAYFGASVSLDGDRLLVGAPDQRYGTSDYAGEAYLFIRSGSVWGYVRSFGPVSTAQDTNFGAEVLIKNGYIFISAPGETVNNIKSGQVYLYTKQGANYPELTKLVPEEAGESDSWGMGLDFDGSSFVLTSYFNLRVPGGGTERGAACFGSVD